MKPARPMGLRATPEFPYGVAFRSRNDVSLAYFASCEWSWEFAFAITGERGPSVNRALLQRVMGGRDEPHDFDDQLERLPRCRDRDPSGPPFIGSISVEP